MNRATILDVPVAVVLLTVVGAVAALVDGDAATVLRGGVWAFAGAVLLLGSSRRREPAAVVRTFAVGALLVGLAWSLQAATGDESVAIVDLALLSPGLAMIGVATIIATPTWRHRAALLDGVVLAIAGATTFVVLVAPGTGTAVDSVVLLAVTGATVLGPAAMVANLVTWDLRPASGSWLPAAALLALLHAGLATVAAATTGAALPGAARVSWVLTPAVWLLLVARPGPRPRRRTTPVLRRPTAARLALLTAVVLMPVAAAALVGGTWLEEGLLAGLAAAIVLAARVALSARFDVEEARAAADVRFDALVEHAAEVLALVDEDDRLFYVSRAVEETFHVQVDRVLGRSLAEIAHPDDVQDVDQLLGRVRDRPGVPLHTRLRLLDGEGATRHAEVTVVDLRHVAGVNAISVTVRDVTERVLLEAELVRQARTDGLTGLATRTVLLDRVDHVLTARRPTAALLFIDVDDFKLINDGFGHAAGDEVLAVLADRIGDALRTHDTAGRMGGDEFAVLLEELADDPVEDAMAVARRIAASSAQPIEVGGEPLAVQVSIGLALPDDGMTAAELFAAADAAMYHAKREKRGIVRFEAGMRASSKSRLRLMRDVREAVEGRTLHVAYQPIVHVTSRELVGVEALLRWTHPVLGPIRPDVVLEHAAAAGLTRELTDAIIDAIAADLELWRRHTGRSLPVALNLSAEQLVRVDPADVLRRLVGTADAVGTLTVEVTETSMLGDIASTALVLEQFRDAGCHVSVDDFGTGYASIGYLRRLPVDRLKIDREFLDGLDAAGVPGSFAEVIQQLATALHLTTIAEGVETEEQLAAVQALGCEMAQGFLFSPAVPMAELLTRSGERRGRATEHVLRL